MTKLIFATLLAFSATAASAQPTVTAISTVQTADLDLSTAKGQRALDLRLNQAAKEVCGTASPADLAGQNEIRRCRVETLLSLSDEREQRVAAASGSPIQVAAR